MKKITIQDIATELGISRATVSRALNDHPAISDSTKERVREACRRMGYVPDVAARGLAGLGTQTVGIVVPDFFNPYFSGLCGGAERYAADNGFRVVLANTLYRPERELETIASLAARQIDGLLIVACSPESQARHKELTGGRPCVYLGCNHGPGCSFVETDNQMAAEQVTRYLWRLGHRRIVFFGGRNGSRTLEHRLTGYLTVMQEAGLLPEVHTVPGDVRKGGEWCAEKAEALFREGVPDAVLAYSDQTAIDLLRTAGRCGVRPPRDFSLAGFDNIQYSSLPRIGLTTVSQHKFRSGELGMKRLLEKIAGDTTVTQDILKPELVIRSSCRAAERL